MKPNLFCKIEYFMRGGFFVYWISKTGEGKPTWQDGKQSVDLTKNFVESRYPDSDIIFSIS